MTIRAAASVLFVLCLACEGPAGAPPAPPSPPRPAPASPAPSTPPSVEPVAPPTAPPAPPPECAPLVACCEALGPSMTGDPVPAFAAACVDISMAIAVGPQHDGPFSCSELRAGLRETLHELARRDVPEACRGVDPR